MSQIGSISFSVYTSSAMVPVEGATVIVRSAETPHKLLGLRITDSSGQTEKIPIVTPDRELSQAPESTTQPWTTLSALVEHPDYELEILEGIQVFPGISTEQPVQLVPRNEFETTEDNTQFFNFTPQPVWR